MFADGCRAKGDLKQIVLVHGDPKPQKILSGLMRDRGHGEIFIPAPNDKLTVA